LQPYRYTVRYIRGFHNIVADYLSRAYEWYHSESCHLTYSSDVCCDVIIYRMDFTTLIANDW